MQVHYVTPIACGVVIALSAFALMVVTVRAAQAGHPPPLSPGSATTILVVIVIGGSYLVLRPDGRTVDVQVTEFLIMLGSFSVAFIASIAPTIVIVRWFAPASIPDEERKRQLEMAREHIREQMEKSQERSTQRILLWHVPVLIVGVIVIAALCVIVLARAFMR